MHRTPSNSDDFSIKILVRRVKGRYGSSNAAQASALLRSCGGAIEAVSDDLVELCGGGRLTSSCMEECTAEVEASRLWGLRRSRCVCGRSGRTARAAAGARTARTVAGPDRASRD